MVEAKTYLRDQTDNDVKAVVVIETDESAGHRVVENRAGDWCKPFWMPDSEFHSLDVENVGLLPDEKFDAVVDAATYRSL